MPGDSRGAAGVALRVAPVEDRAGLDRFIRLPMSLYREDPNWVAPLLIERRDHLNPAKNPFFDEAEVCFWLAWRGELCVGRISAQVNRAHLRQHHDETGHFGFLEAEDDPEVFAALLTTAGDWLRDRGMRRMTGPFSLSINDESGLLVEGFDSPPSMMMGHAHPYYAEHLAAQGFVKAMDLLCYHCDQTATMPASVADFIEKAKRTEGLRVRPMKMARYDEELRGLIDIFNDAWSENWGFVPLSAAEIKHLAKNLRPLVRPEFVAIAELAGEPVAMAVSLPNLNEAIADLEGRLLPFGWVKLLWRLKVRSTKSIRVPLMGVRKRYQGGAMGAALALSVIDAINRYHRDHGVESAELSWILETNLPMRRMIETLGGKAYKTYRIYERSLT